MAQQLAGEGIVRAASFAARAHGRGASMPHDASSGPYRAAPVPVHTPRRRFRSMPRSAGPGPYPTTPVPVHTAQRRRSECQLPLVRPPAGEAHRPAARRQCKRVGQRHTRTQAVGEPCGEGVAAAVGVHRRARQRGGAPCARAAGALTRRSAPRRSRRAHHRCARPARRRPAREWPPRARSHPRR